MVGKDDIEVGYWLCDDIGLWKVIRKSDTNYRVTLLENCLCSIHNNAYNPQIKYNRDDDIILGRVDLLDILAGLE